LAHHEVEATEPEKEDVMYGGLILVVLVSLIALSPVIWFAWWMLADLGSPDNTRRHGIA